MRDDEKIKKLLIRNAIHLIAAGGFEKATTKELTHSGGNLTDTKMNEVYIYRLFGSKEALFEMAFYQVEHALYCEFHRLAEKSEILIADEFRHECFWGIWRFLLEHEEYCRYYVRYYYSAYFRGRPSEAHRKLFASAIALLNPQGLSPQGSEREGVEAMLHSAWITLLDCVIRIHDGAMADHEDTRQHVFKMLCAMTSGALKKPRSPRLSSIAG